MIQVEMTHAERAKLEHWVHIMNVLTKRMRDAGIPLVGVLTIMGVERGRLEMTTTETAFVYRWTDDEDNEL